MIFRRFFAFLIDIFIIIFVTLYGLKIFKLVVKPVIINHEYELIFKFIALLIWAISIPCYFAYFESSRIQGTLSKYLLNIKVIFDDGRSVNFIEAFFRFIIALLINITGIGYIISIIFMLFSKDRKDFHDTFSNTKVVRR